MDTTESLGYLKGLLDGMDLDESKKETKIYRAMIGVLENLAEDVNDLTDGVEMMADQLDAVDEDLGDVEEYLYGDEDDDDCDCGCCDDDEDECQEFEIECPACHETFVVDEDTVLDGSMECPACGETLEFEVSFAERPFVSQQTALSPYGGGQCQPAGVLTLPSGNVA